MNTETYEQIFVNENMIENPQFLKEGAICILVFHADEEQVLTVELPFYIDTVVVIRTGIPKVIRQQTYHETCNY